MTDGLPLPHGRVKYDHETYEVVRRKAKRDPVAAFYAALDAFSDGGFVGTADARKDFRRALDRMSPMEAYWTASRRACRAPGVVGRQAAKLLQDVETLFDSAFRRPSSHRQLVQTTLLERLTAAGLWSADVVWCEILYELRQRCEGTPRQLGPEVAPQALLDWLAQDFALMKLAGNPTLADLLRRLAAELSKDSPPKKNRRRDAVSDSVWPLAAELADLVRAEFSTQGPLARDKRPGQRTKFRPRQKRTPHVTAQYAHKVYSSLTAARNRREREEKRRRDKLSWGEQVATGNDRMRSRNADPMWVKSVRGEALVGPWLYEEFTRASDSAW